MTLEELKSQLFARRQCPHILQILGFSQQSFQFVPLT
eukprot:UN04497